MNMMLLEDCCEILDSMRIPITASDRKEGPYPYYGANGIQDHVDDYIFDDELVLLAEDGGNFGSKERPIAYRVSGKCWVNNHAHVLKPKNNSLDVDYLCYSLMFYNTDGLVNGATRQKLTQATMRKMLIPMRSIEEQKHIVELLNRVVEIKFHRQNELTKLDELIKARFVELFGKFIERTEPVDFENICEFVTVGIANSATHAFCDEGVIMFRNQNIKEDYLDTSDIVHITPDFADKYKTKRLKKNDLLIVRTGYPGVACLVPEEFEGSQTFTTLIARIKSDASINPRFVCHYINSEYGKRYVKDNSAGAAQQNFGATALSKLPVCIPSIELQNEYIRFIEQVDKSKVAVQKSLDETQQLFDSLMQRYFG